MDIKEILFKKHSFNRLFLTFFKVFLPNFLDCFGMFAFVAFIPCILIFIYAVYDINFRCTGAMCGAPWGWVFAFALLWFLLPFFLLSILISVIVGSMSKEYKMPKKWFLVLKIIGLVFYLFLFLFFIITILI